MLFFFFFTQRTLVNLEIVAASSFNELWQIAPDFFFRRADGVSKVCVGGIPSGSLLLSLHFYGHGPVFYIRFVFQQKCRSIDIQNAIDWQQDRSLDPVIGIDRRANTMSLFNTQVARPAIFSRGLPDKAFLVLFVLFNPPYRLHLIKNKNTKHYRHHQKERSFQVAGRLYMSDWEDCSLSSSWSLRRRLTFKQSVSVAQFISRSASLSINLSGDVDGSVGIISPRRMFPIQSFSAQPGKSAEEKSFESKKHDLIKRRFVYSFYLFYLLQSLYSLESRDTLQ